MMPFHDDQDQIKLLFFIVDQCDEHGNCMADSKRSGSSSSRGSSRGSSSRGGSSGGRGSGSSSGRGSGSSSRGGSRDSGDDEGCCIGENMMCSNSMKESNCAGMMEKFGCQWVTGSDCMKHESKMQSLMFSGESAVTEAMNTQVNLYTVLVLAICALVLHFLSRWWKNRKNFEGYTSTGTTQSNEQTSYYQSANSVWFVICGCLVHLYILTRLTIRDVDNISLRFSRLHPNVRHHYPFFLFLFYIFAQCMFWVSCASSPSTRFQQAFCRYIL